MAALPCLLSKSICAAVLEYHRLGNLKWIKINSHNSGFWKVQDQDDSKPDCVFWLYLLELRYAVSSCGRRWQAK